MNSPTPQVTSPVVQQLWTAGADYDKGQRQTIAALVSAQTRREGIFRRIRRAGAGAGPQRRPLRYNSRRLTVVKSRNFRCVKRRERLSTTRLT